MSLRARLRSMVEGMPPGSSVVLPVDWLREMLESDAPEERPLTDLTVVEVAEALGRGESTVRGWLNSGALRGYKLRGHEWRVSRESLRAFQDAEAGPARPDLDNGETVDLGDWQKEVREA